MVNNILCITPIINILGVEENLKKIGNVEYFPNTTISDLISLPGKEKFNILFTNPNKQGFILDEKVLKNFSSLELICTASTGTNHIDEEYCKNRKIEVISMKNDNILKKVSATAEHALGLTIALVRNYKEATKKIEEGIWDCEGLEGRQLRNSCFGIIGAEGRLGKMYKDYVLALHKNCTEKIYTYDTLNKDRGDLNTLLKKSKIISIHIPSCQENYRFFGKGLIEKCGNKPFIVNTSRGDVVDEDEIIKGLESKKISGYATDVLEHELSDIRKSPIWRNKDLYNIYLTCHIGGCSYESQEMIYNKAIEKIRVYLKSKVRFGKERFPPGYQNKVGMKARTLLHDNSKELTEILSKLNILQESKRVFEIGAGGCRNLKYFLEVNPNLNLSCNDLFKEASIKNMAEEVKNKVNFIEIDTLDLFKEYDVKTDILLASDHLMHLQREKIKKIIPLLRDKWSPKYIVLRECKKEAEVESQPRLCHEEEYNRLEKKYNIIFEKISENDNNYYIKVYKKI